MNTEFASIKAITGLATLQEVQDNYDKGWDATDNPSDYYRAFQEVAETEFTGFKKMIFLLSSFKFGIGKF